MVRQFNLNSIWLLLSEISLDVMHTIIFTTQKISVQNELLQLIQKHFF